MEHWSVYNLLRKTRRKDFIRAALHMRDAMADAFGLPMSIKVELYNKVPNHTTMVTELDDLWERKDRAAIFRTLTHPGQLTKADWQAAVYVKAVIRPEVGDDTVAHCCLGLVEAKGLHARHTSFSVMGSLTADDRARPCAEVRRQGGQFTPEFHLRFSSGVHHTHARLR